MGVIPHVPRKQAHDLTGKLRRDAMEPALPHALSSPACIITISIDIDDDRHHCAAMASSCGNNAAKRGGQPAGPLL